MYFSWLLYQEVTKVEMRAIGDIKGLERFFLNMRHYLQILLIGRLSLNAQVLEVLVLILKIGFKKISSPQCQEKLILELKVVPIFNLFILRSIILKAVLIVVRLPAVCRTV